MRMTGMFRVATFVASVALGLGITAQGVGAQSIFERAKRAAEEAAQKPREKQQPQGQQPQPQTPQKAQPSQPSNLPNTAAASSGAESGDCCSADALKKIASSAGFLDIVGIKLGMTPDQAFA